MPATVRHEPPSLQVQPANGLLKGLCELCVREREEQLASIGFGPRQLSHQCGHCWPVARVQPHRVVEDLGFRRPPAVPRTHDERWELEGTRRQQHVPAAHVEHLVGP
eukprot:5148462-Lingulodinium_polyedra.AAC.1